MRATKVRRESPGWRIINYNILFNRGSRAAVGDRRQFLFSEIVKRENRKKNKVRKEETKKGIGKKSQ